LLNTRLRKGYVHREQDIAVIGPEVDLSYRHEHLGNSASTIQEIVSGKHPFAQRLKSAKRPLIIVGANALARNDGKAFLSSLHSFAQSLSPEDKDWKVWNVLQTNASQVAAMDVGYQPGVDEVLAANPKVLFLLGADSGAINKENIPKDCFVIYQGHHGDQGAQLAHAILPGAAYTEKQGTYVNTEGRAQQTLVAVSPPGMAREDWKIIRALSEVVGATLPYDTLDELRNRLEDIAPHLVRYGNLEENNFYAQAEQLLKVS
jgi:NADH dehydrogenase (ubiquinone) Fe-S protein 1